MNETMLFENMQFIRNRTLKLLNNTDESILLTVPKGCNNNLLWNFGHIYWAHEMLLFPFLKEQHHASASFQEMFKIGSSPSTWQQDPPSIEEIKQLLEEQPQRIIETFSGRLEEEGEKPLVLGSIQFSTLAEILCFANWHEGFHQGNISTMKHVLSAE